MNRKNPALPPEIGPDGEISFFGVMANFEDKY